MNAGTGDLGMRRHELVSPEGVRLEFAVAGPAPRIFAYAIDWIIITLLMIFLFVFVFAALPIGRSIEHWLATHLGELSRDVHSPHPNPRVVGRVEGAMIAAVMLAQFVVEFGYFTFWEMVTNGRSPGKAAVGLRVVLRNGFPIDLRSSLVRNVMRIVDLLPAYYLVGLISIVLSPGSERLGDHVAGTIVVRLDRPEAAAEIDTAGGQPALALTREQIARIGPREMQLIRATLRRVEDLPGERSDALLGEVAEAMRARLKVAEPPNHGARTFLREVLALAERYTRNRPG
jgi:uncharacterized RDD family membrane protein YckC